ncbi:MAG: ABC-F family ATP-binding cassette domain-containing protein [Actinomycetota bacterium]|nr:ABC-F family ATP-binding cassette domain-containing protein [Actinomycetota bacterium]
MANLVNLEAVTITRGVITVLSGVSLGVQTGDRIGVLGLNGAGKSTLISLLGGRLAPDAGRVAVAGGSRIEIVDQTTEPAVGVTVRDVALHTFAGGDHSWASDASVRDVLDGLGLGGIGLETPMSELSGGEQRRVALAAALVTEADLLILDEPTNHLDIEGVNWLAAHLRGRRSALIAVTHDRWFLDAVATTTWEVVDEKVEIREGGYSDWVFARAERMRLAQASEERRQNLARKELAWLRRGPPARTAKPRYRIEAAEALIADVPEPRNTVALHSFARRRLGKDVLDLEGATASLPDGRKLLDDVTFRIGPGDRIGIVGVNGSGKSTLLRVLVGLREVQAGIVKRGKTVEIGYLPQDAAELPAELRLLEAISEIAGTVNLGGRDMTASQLAERFGFTHAQQWTRVAELSGGQRRRLQLTRILMASPNILVLDEPTNDLDTDTLTSLEDLLDSWPGTLIVVSHDRYLIERVADNVFALFGDGAITHLPGGIDEYLRRRAQAPVTSTSGTVAAAAARAPARETTDLRALRKELQKLDRQLESLQRKQKQLHHQLHAIGGDYAKATELDGQLRAVNSEHQQAERAWLAVAEQLEG